jgi:adenosylmethionine-8-amino-7-oxononanoate aminotransferase
MHGPTYMANPLACAVALASLELLASGAWRAQVAAIEALMAAELAGLRGLEGVREVRTLGAIAVVEMDGEVAIEAASRAAVARGVWLRPFRNLIYAMPPYVTAAEDLRAIAAAIGAAARVAIGEDGGDG